MKLMIEGLPDEIDDFLSELCGSVPQPAHQDKDIEDRITKLECASCEFADEVWDEIKKLKEENKSKPAVSVHTAPEVQDQDHDRKQKLDLPLDLLIPRFEYDKKLEKAYNKMFFTELPDGRVVLSYMQTKVYTTKDKVMQIPFPIPCGYLRMYAPNKITAFRKYREYLDSVQPGSGNQGPQQDRKEKDLDEPFKPKLKGVFSTHPGKEDFDKVEGTLEG